MWGDSEREGKGGECEKLKVAGELQEAQGCSQVALNELFIFLFLKALRILSFFSISAVN